MKPASRSSMMPAKQPGSRIRKNSDHDASSEIRRQFTCEWSELLRVQLRTYSNRSMLIAGIDYGTVRIGIAMADTEVAIASPYANYNRRSPDLDAAYFRALAKN